MWDYENQPKVVVLSNNGRVTMGYNGDFRRTHKQDMTFGTMRFIWDQSNDNYLLELSEHGSVAAVYTSEPLRYGSITSQRRSDNRHWLHTDFIGSTRQLTTPTGSTSDTLLYDAWETYSLGRVTRHFIFNGSVIWGAITTKKLQVTICEDAVTPPNTRDG